MTAALLKPMRLSIDAARLASELDTLAGFSATPSPAITRIVFTPPDLAARAWLHTLCEEAGLMLRTDAIGNTFARWPGAEPDLPAVATGSHIDALPSAGRFDGTVGVLGALESIRALKASGFRPRRSLELVIFTSEEPTRFGIGCLGSRVLSGALPAASARALVDKTGGALTGDTGKSLDEIRRAAGFNGDLAKVPLPSGHYSAFIELHIEQGPLLERQNIPLGLVTGIAAPASLRLFLEGEGGHAGAVLMPQRRDALTAASEIILAIESAALSTGSPDSVATTGICEVFPSAVNSIPSRVRLDLDVRDTDGPRRDAMLQTIRDRAAEIADRRRVSLQIEMLNADLPAACAPALIETFADACDAHRIPYTRMVSRAYHDSLFMARIAPIAMLFIPCRKGYSHRPEEYASPEHMAAGACVLAEALAALST